MKTYKLHFAVLFCLIILIVTSCGKEDKVDGKYEPKTTSGKVFYASMEGQTAPCTPNTKVYADENLQVLWNEDDRISIFNQTTYNYQYMFNGEDGDNYGSFEEIPVSGFISANPISQIIAVYPYSTGNKVNNTGTKVTMTLPAEQTYKEHSFGVGANSMIAVTSNNFLAFKNVGGYLSFRLYGDDISISSITLRGNNGEKIAGKASIAVSSTTAPVTTMDASATEEITLTCNPAVEIGSSADDYTEFWFVIPPTTFSSGFTITVTDALGGTYEKSTSNSFTVTRNQKDWMNPLKVELNYEHAPTKPTGLKPTGSNIGTITTFSWSASTDPDGDPVTYTVFISKDMSNWTNIGSTSQTTLMNKEELDKNTTYYYKVVADDGYEGGKTESEVFSFTTGTTKSYWADGEVKLYEVNSNGSLTEVSSTSRPFKLIYMGDGYTQDLYKYGGQFDSEINAGVKALFEIEPYKTYYSYFAVYKVAAYSDEAGMSSGSTNWDDANNKVDTKFKCSWYGGNSTAIGCNTTTVIEYAAKCPGYTGSTDYETRTNLSWSPISIIINADQYAGTNIWTSGNMGGMKMISIAQTPARHPSTSSYGGFAYTLRHEYGGHGIGLLGDEYVYYSSTAFPHSNESTFRYWQGLGAYCNTYLPQWNSSSNSWYSDSDNCNLSLTPVIEGENWRSFADRSVYSGCNINLHAGSHSYGVGVYRSENSSCMINNIPHYNTFSRWRIYCRIKITAGETPTIDDFIAHDNDKTNAYGSAAPSTKVAAPDSRRCEGPILIDPYHSKPYRLK